MTLLGVVAILALLFVSTRSPAALDDGRRDLVIWGVNLGPDSKGTEAVIREFERRNPKVRVRIQSMGAGRMDPQKLMTSIVGNVAPDVINQDRFTIADWASRGAFLPLDPLIGRDKDDPLVPRKEDYYEAPWLEASYNGQIYGIPTAMDNRILYWNKARFREKAAELRAAGLDPDRAPQTWSELLAYSKVLTELDKSGRIVKAGYLPNFGNCWLYMYCFLANGDYMSPDGRTCTLYSTGSEEALNFMMDGYNIVGGYQNSRAFESGLLGKENDPFILGKVAMKIDGDWILNDLSRYGPQLDMGTAPPPVPDDRFHKRGRYEDETETWVTWSGGFSWAIPKGARNVDDAWEYIKFANSREGILVAVEAQKDWEALRGRSFIPAQQSNRVANEELYRRYLPADPKFAAALRMHVDMAPHGRTRPSTFVGQLLWSEHAKAMETALYKRASPAEALKISQATVQRDLDAFFSKEKYAVADLSLPAYLALALFTILGVATVIGIKRARLGRLARHEARWAYLFVSPWVIGFLVLTLGPMVASFIFSFTQYDVLNEARWVGGKNYSDIVGADWTNVSKGLSNSAYLAFGGVPLSLATGLAVALLLNTASRGIRVYRTIYYLPAIVPGVASAVLWVWVLTADPNKGLINAGWNQTLTPWLGINPPAWMASADWSKNALIMMGLWGAGSGMILWLAGLKGISNTLYEAANIDGASPWKQFWSVTFPQLTPIIFFNLVMGVIGAMQEFDRIYIMRPASDGSVGPDDSLLTPVFHLFRNGFGYFKMGYASALAWTLLLIILVLTAAQFKLSPKWVYYEADK